MTKIDDSMSLFSQNLEKETELSRKLWSLFLKMPNRQIFYQIEIPNISNQTSKSSWLTKCRCDDHRTCGSPDRVCPATGAPLESLCDCKTPFLWWHPEVSERKKQLGGFSARLNRKVFVAGCHQLLWNCLQSQGHLIQGTHLAWLLTNGLLIDILRAIRSSA